ncbi:hypothetical protein LCGC14_2541980, partial [marine sediment metagenome]
SSSSSFVAVGVSRGGYNGSTNTAKDKQLFIDLVNAMNAPTSSYDYDDFYSDGKYSSAALRDHDYGTMQTSNGSELCLYGGNEFWFVGLDAIPLFEKDMKLSEIKKQFQETVKKHYDVKVNLSQIKLRNDEVSSE